MAVLIALILKINKLSIGIKDIHTLQVIFARHRVKFIVLLILDRIITVPNLTRLESTSIELIRGSEPNKTRINEYRPNKSRDLQTVTGFTNSYITHKGIYIARSPSILLAP
jgi:hypothetical protein